jgi:thiamine biosynthesis lipoprotein
MRSFLRPTPVERARPGLGTIVVVRASFEATEAARDAIEAAFAQVARVHRLMSFHEPTSDLSRLNRDAVAGDVQVDPATFVVLKFALEAAEASDGLFDPAVGAQAVAAGALPRPAGAPEPDAAASWRDVELDAAGCAVRFRRPLWLDLGGIAKGYAVDLALEALRAAGCAQASVNAGGDLRLAGPEAELVHLRCGRETPDALPVIELQDAAAASSGSAADPAFAAGVHLDGRSRAPVPADRFATVIAPSCMAADALTKPVMAAGEASAGLLRRYGACAYLLDAAADWRCFGTALA